MEKADFVKLAEKKGFDALVRWFFRCVHGEFCIYTLADVAHMVTWPQVKTVFYLRQSRFSPDETLREWKHLQNGSGTMSTFQKTCFYFVEKLQCECSKWRLWLVKFDRTSAAKPARSLPSLSRALEVLIPPSANSASRLGEWVADLLNGSSGVHSNMTWRQFQDLDWVKTSQRLFKAS